MLRGILPWRVRPGKGGAALAIRAVPAPAPGSGAPPPGRRGARAGIGRASDAVIPSLRVSIVHPSRAGTSTDETSGDDLDFVDRLIARDETAFADLVRTHGPRMLSVAARYLRDPLDAEDALQDAFVNVVRSISGFRRGSSIETWLHRIVVNCALMILRRRRRKPSTPLEDSALESGGASPWRRWPPPSAHDVLASEEARRMVLRAVDRLPEAQRCVLLLRDVEALSLGDIAEVLGLRVTTVKIRLHRARRALQSLLGPGLWEAFR